MHDVVRNVAISIASRDDKMCTMSYGRGSTEWIEDEAFRKYNAVLINTENFHKLPQKLMFPNLELLISLSSFHSLANLQTLCLWFCELVNMDMIKELKKLEILSFRGCKIKEVPPAIGQLTQLKSLDLKYCYELEVIPPNVISKLIKLEELDMEGNSSIIPKQLFLGNLKLERFQIVLGTEWPEYTFNTSKVMYLKVDSKIIFSEVMKRLLCRSEELYLEVVHGKDVLIELDENDVPPLRHLHLFDMLDTRYLIGEKASLNGLTNLEMLSLNRMMNLENTIHGCIKVVPFNKLKIIKVVECKALRNLFLSSIMSGLSSLQTIDVSGCEMIEAIVGVEDEATSQFECSKLTSLSLIGLPWLTSFCLKVEQPSQIIQYDVQHWTPFFNGQVAFPSLETLVLSGLHKLKTIWHNGLTVESFSKLKWIQLTRCKSLRIVFPSNTIRMFKSLEKLEIQNCELIEEIFEIHWSNTKEEGDIFATQLRYLDLKDLPRLKNVWNRDPQEFVTLQNIAGVTVEGCPELKSLFPASFTTNLQLLESLVFERCGLEQIFVKEERFETTKIQFVFPKVSFLTLDCTLVMRDLWYGQSPRDLFPRLKALALLGSDNYKWSISMTNLPFGLAELMFIVDELHVIDSFLVELFPDEGFFTAEENQVGRSAPLR
ncbi:unnamed protein product [Citrullus colocynthis]|uniref:Disease resistance protein At4g27190-like leucine-rich repeats domain-containing protein n=1 Tax=Citrullus colocynthis TaxID=252529 RepID=A0ABP0Y3B8_9ROSI